MKNITIRTKRLIIQTLDRSYLEQLRQLRNDPTINQFLTTTIRISKTAQTNWYKRLQEDKTRMYFLILLKDKQFIGVIRSDEYDKVNKSIRIGLDIDKKFHNQGFATEAYKAYLNYLFNVLKINRVWLEVLDYNVIALHLYGKLGFIKEGEMREAVYRNNNYHDYIIMSLLKKDYEKKSQ